MNAANADASGDTITVPAGSYRLSLGALSVSAPMTVLGAGARATTVFGSGSDRVFDVTAAANPVVIQGLTISGGAASPNNGYFGGNVRNSGNLTLLQDTIRRYVETECPTTRIRTIMESATGHDPALWRGLDTRSDRADRDRERVDRQE